MSNVSTTSAVSEEVMQQMYAAMDLAAKEFWDYPDAQWQANFSKHWLYMNNPPRHEMFAAMDLAAKEFDEYPDGKWQAAFEASWFSTKS